MTLRAKILWAQTPMLTALALIVAAALYAAVRFGLEPGVMLRDNFRSVDAARGILGAMDALDAGVVSAALHGSVPAGEVVSEAKAVLEREVLLQESNITEPGEDHATAAMRQAFIEYVGHLEEVRLPADLEAHQQRSIRLRQAVDRIVQINRAAMREKSEEARREARWVGVTLATTALIAFSVAMLTTNLWLRRLLAPLRVLERAVGRLADGDFETRVHVTGKDEVALLAASFNAMAGRLFEYRRSSLGELIDANSRLASVMDSLADAVVVYDLSGSPLVHNEAALRLLGSDGLAIDMLPEALRDAVRDVFFRVRRDGDPYEPGSLEAALEVPAVPAPRWILVSATPVRPYRGVLSGVTVALRDVTRARRIEGFRGDLIAAAAHELRTPLTSLHMAVHLCLERAAGPLTEKQEDLLAAGRQDCERLQEVVDELLEMARLESGTVQLQRSQVHVCELLQEAVGRHEAEARNARSALYLLPGDSLLSVEVDGERIRHVLDNLIDNAIKHAGQNGAIQVGFEAQDSEVRVFVDDAGPGIPPELRERVFEKFFRVPGTAKQGSGLGLSIVRDIVHAHGGSVGVDVSPLGGARFWFSLPYESSSS